MMYSRTAQDRHEDLITAYFEGFQDATRPYDPWHPKWRRAAEMCQTWMREVHHVNVDQNIIIMLWGEYINTRNIR